jgi:hypothetical protein
VTPLTVSSAELVQTSSTASRRQAVQFGAQEQ